MQLKILRFVLRLFMKLIATIDSKGLEKLPGGNMIGVVNHLGRLDTALLFCLIDRDDIILPVAEKYKQHPIYGALSRVANVVWLNRFETDYAALRKILEHLEQGGFMMIAPEGTRSKTEALQEGKMGAAFLASKSGYPIVPVALTGTEDRGVIENLKHFRRTKITVNVANPYYISIPAGSGRAEAMRQATEEIMCQIAALLPEKYRGVYADHPRLKELLKTHA